MRSNYQRMVDSMLDSGSRLLDYDQVQDEMFFHMPEGTTQRPCSLVALDDGGETFGSCFAFGACWEPLWLYAEADEERSHHTGRPYPLRYSY